MTYDEGSQMATAPEDRPVLVMWGGQAVIAQWRAGPPPGWRAETHRYLTGNPERWWDLPVGGTTPADTLQRELGI